MGSFFPPEPEHVDVLIIGAGLSGICSLYHIRERFPSWRVKCLEAGEGVGGTWYWNRYPGARFDSESLSYCFSWDKEMLEEWHWKEAFAPQTETLKYLERVCEKNNLYKDVQFNTRIKSARWQDTPGSYGWVFTDEAGSLYKATFFISCLGFLSSPSLPNIPGIETFSGQSFHTSRWPKSFDMKRDLSGKRIGVIGTGATGIQTITAISKESGHKSLTVFQRTANWSAPLRNSEITNEQMELHRANYDEVFQRCADTPLGFLHKPDPRLTGDVSPDERIKLWEKLYSEPGFTKWQGTFRDSYTNREANKEYSDFMANKIRERVKDPAVAEALIPKNHGFGTRRIPLESGYFEAYNQPNVRLVDLQEFPIEKITAKGVLTSNGEEHELDMLIYATGFDAITGAFSAIDWRGKDDRPLLGTSDSESGAHAVWVDHQPRTFLGITVPSMPNMFMVLGPHQPLGNATRNIEHAVKVISNLLAHCRDNGFTYVEPSAEAVDRWTDHVLECSKGSLVNEVDSWMTGVNRNKGKTVRNVVRYAGSAIDFRKKCEACKLAAWEGLHFA